MNTDLGIRTILSAEDLFDQLTKHHNPSEKLKCYFHSIAQAISLVLDDGAITKTYHWEHELKLRRNTRAWGLVFSNDHNHTGLMYFLSNKLIEHTEFDIALAHIKEDKLYLDYKKMPANLRGYAISTKYRELSIDTVDIDGQKKYLVKEQKRKLRRTARGHSARKLGNMLLEQKLTNIF